MQIDREYQVKKLPNTETFNAKYRYSHLHNILYFEPSDNSLIILENEITEDHTFFGPLDVPAHKRKTYSYDKETKQFNIIENAPTVEAVKQKNDFNNTEIETAPKDISGKSQPSLVPLDLIYEILLPALSEGVIKYKRDSWRKGIKVSDCYDALQRHLTDFYFKHEDYDKEYPEKHHLGAVIFYAIAMYNSPKKNNVFDDRPV